MDRNEIKRDTEKVVAHPVVRTVILALSLLIIFVFAATLLLNLFTRHNRYKMVPDYVGVRIEDVCRQARHDRLRIEVIDSLYVPTYDGGVVLEQRPASGTKVKSGRRIFVTTNSFRQKMVEVPYVTGYSLRQAKNILETAGLTISKLSYVTDLATNYVLAEYLGDTPIDKNSKLQAEVGSGITLTVGRSASASSVSVPNVIGLLLPEAKSRLWEAGLNIGKITYDEGVNALNERQAYVFIQTPEHGSTASLGNGVSLRLTLDGQKASQKSIDAEKVARQRNKERIKADSLTDTPSPSDSKSRAAATSEPDEFGF